MVNLLSTRGTVSSCTWSIRLVARPTESEKLPRDQLKAERLLSLSGRCFGTSHTLNWPNKSTFAHPNRAHLAPTEQQHPNNHKHTQSLSTSTAYHDPLGKQQASTPQGPVQPQTRASKQYTSRVTERLNTPLSQLYTTATNNPPSERPHRSHTPCGSLLQVTTR